jgi:hypothetical protein
MNKYKMGVESLLNFTNCLFRDNGVVLGALSASYNGAKWFSRLQLN